ncbi:hypothetical protein N473_26170 [Pseudoalteromonas luteoviolacea CPMOR-1]|uniref:Uncharacterized protein n=1 Tax=Pseudoalteromonas luteoviolacea CPMOR-1 TaxID=1365248 RepID=A0A161XYC5_9GAMM|nr:hypothetical protein N473_26170 [Pseudoalteromonas luteoviolacea CPMOR-1]
MKKAAFTTILLAMSICQAHANTGGIIIFPS